MLTKMLEVLLTMNFIWSWLLVFPVSVGMEWNDAINQAVHSSLVQDCSTITSVKANLDLDSRFPNNKDDNIKLTATLTGDETDKGCGRSTYNVVPLYKKCGEFNRVTELLPTLKEEDDSNITREVSPRGSLNYVFDGGTAIRYPAKTLPRYWFISGYTISGWISPVPDHKWQYVLSWSDGDTSDHQNMGFFLKRTAETNRITFGFFHTNEDPVHRCTLRKNWRFETLRTWHFVALQFSKSCTVQLFINGQQLEEITKPVHVYLPERHLQPKFVIGARWAGNAKKYEEYFQGRISGLVLLPDKKINQTILDCLLECKEKLSLPTILPSSFTVQYNQDGSFMVHGKGDNEMITKILNDIYYEDDSELPSRYQKRMTIKLEKLNTQFHVSKNVDISVDRGETAIAITSPTHQHHIKNVSQTTIKITPNISIEIKGCMSYLDQMNVTLHEPFERETISLPELSGLKYRRSETGVVVYGASTVETYRKLLQGIQYKFGDEIFHENSTRGISISLSAYNGLVKSNVLEISIKPSEQKILYFSLLDSLKTTICVGKEDERRGVALHWALFALLVGIFSLIPVIVFVGYKKYQKYVMLRFVRRYDSQIICTATPAECLWDEEALCLKINPTERISICNDPYTDLLNKEKPTVSYLLNSSSVTDDSDDEDDIETDFDNDSIRQLEWDCLENSLTYEFNDVDGRCSPAQELKTRQLFP